MIRAHIPIFLGAIFVFAAFVCGYTDVDLGNAPDCRHIQYENVVSESTEEEVIIPEDKDDVYANRWDGSVIKSPEFYRITTAMPPKIFNADKARRWTTANAIELKREWDTENLELAKIMQSIWEATHDGKYNIDYRYTYTCKDLDNIWECYGRHEKKVVVYVKSINDLGFICSVDDGLSPNFGLEHRPYPGYIIIKISW